MHCKGVPFAGASQAADDEVAMPQLVIAAVVALLVGLLISEDDEEPLEDGEEVDEELEAMHDVVCVAQTTLLYDQLSVVHHEAAHDNQADVQVSLEEQPGCDEEVDDGEHEEGGEYGAQGAAQVQEVASGGEQRG